MRALTLATMTDDDLKEEIAELDTEIAILQAALKIKRGPLVDQIRGNAVVIINLRRERDRAAK